MKIAQSKTRDQFPLSTKKIIKKTISSTIGYAVLLLVMGTAFAFAVASSILDAYSWFESAIIIFFVLLLLIFILEYIYQRWYFATYFYDLTPDFIQVKKGPITPREITIPYERIQDIYVDQDLLDRIFGLYDVHLSSAAGGAAHIDGVSKQAADGLREIILQTVKQKISRNKTINTSATDTAS
jgi:putative membrane protein